MPDPISSSPLQSSYGAASCDPDTMCCEPELAPASQPTATAEPATTTGAASSEALVADYDRAHQRARAQHQPPTCAAEESAALHSCASVALGGVGLALSSSTGLGLVISTAALLENLAKCFGKVDGYSDCLDEGAARAEEANQCELRGGKAVGGVEPGEVVCLELDP